MTIPYHIFEESEFRGLNTSLPPEALPPGFVQQADNVFNDFGYLKMRPGLRAKLTAALGFRIYASTPYQKANAERWALFAAGDGTGTAGRIYSWQKDATSATYLAALGTFDETRVQFAQIGDWVFISGNADGKLRRYNFTTAEIADGLSTPVYTTSPTATLTNKQLSTLNTTANWEQDRFASTSMTVAEYQFANATTTPTNTPLTTYSNSEWPATGGNQIEAAVGSTVDSVTGQAIDSVNTTRKYTRMDDGVVLTSANFIDIPAKTNDNDTSSTRQGLHFDLSIDYKPSRVTDAIKGTIILYNSGGTELSRVTQVYSLDSVGGNTPTTITKRFSFGDIDDATADKVKLLWEPGEQNVPAVSASSGPFFSNIVLNVLDPVITFADNGDYTDVSFPSAAGTDPQHIPCGGIRLVYQLDSALDLSAKSQIAIPFRMYVGMENVRVRLGVKIGTNAAASLTDVPSFTDVMTLATTEDGITYLAGDLSTIAAADRGSGDDVQHIVLDFQADITITSGYANTGQALFGIGALSEAGNLSVGYAPYEWAVVEKINADSIYSGRSVVTNGLNPNTFKASGQISWSHATFPYDSDSDRFVVIRRGGTFTDGLWREVQTFAPTSDTSGTYFTYDYTAPGSAAQAVFTDNTPDSALLTATTYTEHEPPPANIRAIAARDGRLLAATDTGFYVSALSSGKSAGLYWNSVNDPNAPLATQGYYRQLAGQISTARSPVQAISVFLDYAIVWFLNEVWYFGGNDPNDYYLRRSSNDEGRGLLARRAVCTAFGSMWFLSSDGLRRLTIDGSERVGKEIDKSLLPGGSFSGAALNASAMQNASLFAHAGRLFLSVPQPGASIIGATFVWDERTDSWTRWLLGEVSGGLIFTTDSDTQDLYVTTGVTSGSTGQIYAVTGNTFGDTATAAGSVTNVTATVKSRRFVAPGRQLLAERLLFTVDGAGSSAANVYVLEGDDATANQWTDTFTTGTTEQTTPNLKAPGRVRGRGLHWSLSYAGQAGWVLKRVRLEAAETRMG